MPVIYSLRLGFTLLELAITMVIVGLIAGGIMIGADMIQGYQIRAQISQIKEFDTAVNGFMLQYNQLPGDSSQATTIGYSKNSSGSTNTCYTTNGAPHSVNGNGNGVLEAASADTKLRFTGELLNFWTHLANSGFISGNYSQTVGACQKTQYAGIDYPKAKIGEGIIAVSSSKLLYFVLGGFGVSHNYDFSDATEGGNSNIADNRLSTYEAYALDEKIDDGYPLTGGITVIISYIYAGPAATKPYVGTLTLDNVDNATNCVYNSAYNITVTGDRCTLAILSK